jgi:fido (protein-threonine AMPylation protein)
MLPLAREAERLRRAVRLPLGQRPPAAFERAFLDAYRPGETYYLPLVLRQRLAAIGRTDDAGQPGGTYARQVLQRLLIDLSWNSSRLEGNTYSLLDTERLVLEGREAEGKALTERQMIVNHKAAIEWMVEEASEAAPRRLHASTLRNLHALLAHNLLGDPSDEGRVRTRTVHIHGSTFVPLDVPPQVEECLTQIALTAAAIDDAFEQSFFLLVHIPYLQPFIDGNKRTARLAANLPFIRDNLRPLTFVDVPQAAYIEAVLAVYELRRVELLQDVFVWAYERSCARYAAVQKSLGEPDPFRLIHRALIKETLAALVRAGHLADDAVEVSGPFAARLAAADRPRFIAVIEAELRALHDGNYARYGLRPSEFEAWVRSGGRE